MNRAIACALAALSLITTPAMAKGCKDVANCREAVEMWCGGYSGADRDNDGIPCENVCRTKEQVDAILKKIGCEK